MQTYQQIQADPTLYFFHSAPVDLGSIPISGMVNLMLIFICTLPLGPPGLESGYIWL